MKKPPGVMVIAVMDLLMGSFLLLSGISNAILIIGHKLHIIAWAFVLLLLFMGWALLDLCRRTYKFKARANTDNRAVAILGALVALFNLGLILQAKFYLLLGQFLLCLFVYFIWAIIYLTIPKIKQLFNN